MHGAHSTRVVRRSRRASRRCRASIPASDLSRLNGAAGDWVDISPRLAGALRLALRGREATNGRFDPTILPALVAAGYDRTLRGARRATGPRCARLAGCGRDRGRCRRRSRPASSAEPRSISAGSARAFLRRVRSAPCAARGTCFPGALVDIGGDIAVSGSPPDGAPGGSPSPTRAERRPAWASSASTRAQSPRRGGTRGASGPHVRSII